MLRVPFASRSYKLLSLIVSRSSSDMAKKTGGKKNKNKNKKKNGTEFTFPGLHDRVNAAVMATAGEIPIWFNELGGSYKKNYNTNIMGRFACGNQSCRKPGWNSNVVAIWIQGFEGNGYNAIVYNQNCRSCGTLGIMTIDEQCYVDRVSYRILKWAGIETEHPQFTEKKTDPHEQKLCEGCKAGHCLRGERIANT